MPGDPAGEVKTVREKLKAGERGGTEADRERLLDFSDRLQLLAQDYSDVRHIKLLRHLMRISENVDFPDESGGPLVGALKDREIAEEIVRWINRTYDNPETNRDYRVALRVFGKRLEPSDDDEPPVSISWVSSKTPSNYDPSPNPAELIDWDDVDAMVEAAGNNTRDAAMVALMLDAGPRGGEFYDLRVSDVTDADHGMQLWIDDGKTGQRSVTLIPSVPQVQRWLEDHPGGASDYLWTKLNEPERISRQRIYQILDRLSERAEIGKHVRATQVRKANAMWLAKTGAQTTLIETRQGRKIGSGTIARYVAQFGERSENSAYAQLMGRDVDVDGAGERDIVECPRCDKPNAPDKGKCQWCGQALDPESAAAAEAQDRKVNEALANLEPEVAKQLFESLEVIKETPELRAAFYSSD